MESLNFAQNLTAYMEAGMMSTTVYLTVTSGYLITVYLVGSKLSLSQLLTVSILYSIFALMFAFGSYSFFTLGILLVSESPGEFFFVSQYLPVGTFLIETTGIVAAIKFTVDVRRKG